MRCITDVAKEAVRDYAKASIVEGTRARSDELGCWNVLDDAGMRHEPKVTGGGRPRGGDFKWVNTALGNIKSPIIGTCRSCDIHHTPRYLAACEWRINCRFDLDQNLVRLAGVAVTIKPQPYRKLSSVRSDAAETRG